MCEGPREGVPLCSWEQSGKQGDGVEAEKPDPEQLSPGSGGWREHWGVQHRHDARTLAAAQGRLRARLGGPRVGCGERGGVGVDPERVVGHDGKGKEDPEGPLGFWFGPMGSGRCGGGPVAPGVSPSWTSCMGVLVVSHPGSGGAAACPQGAPPLLNLKKSSPRAGAPLPPLPLHSRACTRFPLLTHTRVCTVCIPAC